MKFVSVADLPDIDPAGLAPVSAAPTPRPLTASPFRWPDPSTMPTREWVYGTLLIRRYVSALIAPGGVGKSAYCRSLAMALATGRPLLGERVPRPASVWLYNLEDPLEEIERGLSATALHYAVGPDDCPGRLHVNSGRDQPLIIATAPREGLTIAEPVVEALVSEMRRGSIDVLIVDPFVSSHSVSENDNSAIDRVVKTWASIADRTNASVLLVHHTRKTGGQEVTAEDARGGSAIIGAVRAARVLNKMSKEQAGRAGVEHPWAHIAVGDGKANLAPPAADGTWFKLENVGLGNGCDLKPEDRVGVAVPWEWPNAFEDVSLADLRRVQEIVAKGRYRESNQATDWVGGAVAEVLGLNLADAAARAKVLGLVKTWLASDMLRRVEGMDETGRKRPFIEVGQLAE